ncbi:MAG: hypothetical protein JNL82_38865 [Myxococcales bacterium]|nr:hypothetical protein [Myxococcales bacterium]
MRPRHAVLLVSFACAAPQPPEPPPSADPPAPPAEAAAPNRRERFPVGAWEQGIVATNHPMDHFYITHEPARLLRSDGERLYFFEHAAPVLRVIDPHSEDRSTRILELDPIDHPRFPSSDPLAFLQKQADLAVDGAVLCIDLHDRPTDSTATYNIRIDLVDGTQVRHLVEDLAGDQCGILREAVRPRLCTPHGPSEDNPLTLEFEVGYTRVLPRRP